MKRLWTCLLAALVACCAVGCSPTPPKSVVVPTADELLAAFDSDKTMMIGAWGMPDHGRDAYRIEAEMGITHVFIDDLHGARFVPAERKEDGSKDLLDLEEWFGELGLKAVYQTYTSTSDSNIRIGSPYWRNYDCMDMINICDEPVMSVMDKLEETVGAFDEAYGDTFTCFTNLWPASAGQTNIGASYDDYLAAHKRVLSRITRGRRILSVDVYPLIDRNGDLSLDTTWLRNMYDAKVAAEEVDAEFHMYVQSVGYAQHRRPTTEAEIGMQVWTDLCFGIDGYTYFTYAGDGSTDNWRYTPAIVRTSDGTPYLQELYDGAKAVNARVHALDPVYQGFDWVGIMAVQGTLSEQTDSGIFQLNKVRLKPEDVDFVDALSGTVGTLAGVFAMGERDALILSNYTDPKDSLTDEVKVTFADATHALVYHGDGWELIPLKKGKLTIRLLTGEGAFVLPYRFE